MSELKLSICKKKCLHTNMSSNRNEGNCMSYPLYTSSSPLDLSCKSNLIYNKDILAPLSHKKLNLKCYIHYLHEYKFLLLHFTCIMETKFENFNFLQKIVVYFFLIASINILLKISQLSQSVKCWIHIPMVLLVIRNHPFCFSRPLQL